MAASAYARPSSSGAHLDIIKRSNPSEEYDLLQRVGQGTYGEVYKGTHIGSGDLVAIKVIKLEPGNNFTLIQQEILMLRDCVHPNIISYHNSYLRRDRLWIVMEYCGGGSLQDIYNLTGPLSELQIAFVSRETLKGLQYLHSIGKVHRDIKGANILLSDQGDVKLADFGVAAQITATIGKRRTFIGTPYWMAPEVAAVGRKGIGYNQQCDVWAVGITAIELAELQPPYFDMHPMALLVHMTKASYKIPTLKSKVKWSPYFHEFVKQCLQKNPKKRPTPEKLLAMNHFVQGSLSARLTRDLLDRVNNPAANVVSPIYESVRGVRADDDDDEPTSSDNVPKRIMSRHSADDWNGNRQSQERMSADGDRQPKRLSFVQEIEFALEATSESSKLNVDLTTDSEPGTSGSPYSSNPTVSVVDMPAQQQTPDILDHVRPSSKRAAADVSALDLTIGRTDPSTSEPDDWTLGRPEHPQHTDASFIGTREDTPEGSSDSESYLPLALRSKSRQNRKNSLENGTRERTVSFGLPPTPKVPMGAGFSKVFHCCPLSVHCTASWVHPETKDQLLLFGTEQGIFALNLNELHEATLERIHPRRCTWLYVINDVLMAVQGRTPHLYRHDLVALFLRDIMNRLSLPMNKLPEKFVPRKLAITTRISETRDCLKCCVQRNPYNGNRYLCAAVPSGVVMMQWYEPLSKFLIIKQSECRIPLPLNAFEMLISPEKEFPMICTGVRKGADRKHLVFDLVSLSSGNVNWYEAQPCRTEDLSDGVSPPPSDVVSGPSVETSLHENCERLQITTMRQLDRDVVLVCYANKVQVTNLEGQLKSSRESPAELRFPFRIESALCLADSVIAFHRHGLQGRAFQAGQPKTQDINDSMHTYRLLGSDRVVALEQRLSAGGDEQSTSANNGVDICILSGHESTF